AGCLDVACNIDDVVAAEKMDAVCIIGIGRDAAGECDVVTAAGAQDGMDRFSGGDGVKLYHVVDDDMPTSTDESKQVVPIRRRRSEGCVIGQDERHDGVAGYRQ